MMEFVCEATGVPEGSYNAKFVGVESIAKGSFAIDKPTVKWTWEVTGGAHAGRTVSCLSDAKLSPDNKTGKVIRGMMGRGVVVGEKTNVEGCVGKAYVVIVGPTKSGAMVVQSVSQPPPM